MLILNLFIGLSRRSTRIGPSSISDTDIHVYVKLKKYQNRSLFIINK